MLAFLFEFFADQILGLTILTLVWGVELFVAVSVVWRRFILPQILMAYLAALLLPVQVALWISVRGAGRVHFIYSARGCFFFNRPSRRRARGACRGAPARHGAGLRRRVHESTVAAPTTLGLTGIATRDTEQPSSTAWSSSTAAVSS